MLESFSHSLMAACKQQVDGMRISLPMQLSYQQIISITDMWKKPCKLQASYYPLPPPGPLLLLPSVFLHIEHAQLLADLNVSILYPVIQRTVTTT